MKEAPIPENEVERLRELNRYQILNTNSEDTFDDITKLAATLSGAKIALVSLVSSDKQWFKSKYGLEVSETPRNISFCGHAIMDDGPFIVEDAELDERFCDNPLFLNVPHVRFYAGFPLISPKGYRIGTLCIIDSKKLTLNETQIFMLKSLSKHVIDLLELRIKNEELTIIRDQYRDVQILTQTGGWELDLLTQKILWSDEIFNIYKIQPGILIDRDSAISFFSEEEKIRVAGLIEDCEKQGYPFDTEVKFFDSENQIKWIRMIGKRSHDLTGKVKKIIGTIQDVTALKLTELNLKEILKELNQFFELSLNYLFIAGFDGKLRKFNRAWMNLGFSEVELKEISLMDLVHPMEKDLFLNELQKLSAGIPSIDFEIRYRVKDGSYRYFRLNASSDAENKLIFAVASDITELKKKELINFEISELRAKYILYSSDRKKFFNYLLDKLLLLTESQYGFIGEILEDEDGKFLKTYAITDISWNEETSKFYKESAPRGLVFRDLNTLFGEVIKTGKFLMTNDAKNHPKAGGIPPGHPPLKKFLGIPIYSRNKFIAMVGLANREQGYSQALLEELNPLMTLIGEMLNSISVESQLEHQKNLTMHNSRLAMIGQLAAGVGHEINNPLQIIMGHLSLAKDQYQKMSNNNPSLDLNPRFEKMATALTRIANIVKGLRTFARSDDAQISVFNLSDLIQETVDLLFDIYRKEEVSLIFNGPRREELIEGNRGRIHQVIMNLIANAKDATEDCSDKKIEISLMPNGEFLTIVIADNGKGIPEELRDKIFEPFFTTKDVNKGTGIGLSLVSTIVKEHGGELHLESTPGKGSKFYISLPFKKN